jgi:hypothetical protein
MLQTESDRMIRILIYREIISFVRAFRQACALCTSTKSDKHVRMVLVIFVSLGEMTEIRCACQFRCQSSQTFALVL